MTLASVGSLSGRNCRKPTVRFGSGRFLRPPVPVPPVPVLTKKTKILANPQKSKKVQKSIQNQKITSPTIQNQRITSPHPAKKRGLGPLGAPGVPPSLFGGVGRCSPGFSSMDSNSKILLRFHIFHSIFPRFSSKKICWAGLADPQFSCKMHIPNPDGRNFKVSSFLFPFFNDPTYTSMVRLRADGDPNVIRNRVG